MISGEIEDWQITASSNYPSEWDKGWLWGTLRPSLPRKQTWMVR